MTDTNQDRTVPGMWMVRLKSYATAAIQSNHMSFVAERTTDETPFNVEVLSVYDLPEARAYCGKFDEATKAQVEQQPEVAGVDPVKLYDTCAITTVTNNSVPWGLARISNYGKVPAARPYTYKYNDAAQGQGVIAYVLDTGINEKHEQFQGRAQKGPMFVTPPFAGAQTSVNDVKGHGTHCAGTIGGKDYGVAKKVQIVGIKIFNDLPRGTPESGARTNDIVDAVNHVIKEFKRHKQPCVINMSLSGSPDESLDNIVASAVRAGVAVCVAAGNAGLDGIPHDADTRSPARSPLAITIAASDVNDNLASFSYYGSLVDIVAPGVGVESAWIGPNNNETRSSDGTSMACPHVVGIACTILSNPKVVDKSPFNVASELLIQADKNRVMGLSGNRIRTVDAVAHADLERLHL